VPPDLGALFIGTGFLSGDFSRDQLRLFEDTHDGRPGLRFHDIRPQTPGTA
jgi:hypothetical protein